MDTQDEESSVNVRDEHEFRLRDTLDAANDFLNTLLRTVTTGFLMAVAIWLIRHAP